MLAVHSTVKHQLELFDVTVVKNCFNKKIIKKCPNLSKPQRTPLKKVLDDTKKFYSCNYYDTEKLC